MQILNTPSNLIRSNSRGVSIKKAAFDELKQNQELLRTQNELQL